MKKFNVTIEQIRTATVQVEAMSEEEAERIAMDEKTIGLEWDASSLEIREDLTEEVTK
jgi:hypothetical protein